MELGEGVTERVPDSEALAEDSLDAGWVGDREPDTVPEKLAVTDADKDPRCVAVLDVDAVCVLECEPQPVELADRDALLEAHTEGVPLGDTDCMEEAETVLDALWEKEGVVVALPLTVDDADSEIVDVVDTLTVEDGERHALAVEVGHTVCVVEAVTVLDALLEKEGVVVALPLTVDDADREVVDEEDGDAVGDAVAHVVALAVPLAVTVAEADCDVEDALEGVAELVFDTVEVEVVEGVLLLDAEDEGVVEALPVGVVDPEALTVELGVAQLLLVEVLDAVDVADFVAVAVALLEDVPLAVVDAEEVPEELDVALPVPVLVTDAVRVVTLVKLPVAVEDTRPITLM